MLEIAAKELFDYSVSRTLAVRIALHNMTHISESVDCRPMLPLLTSGRYQTCMFFRKNSFPASRTIRGKVTNPTHHQEATNLRRWRVVMFLGSMGEPVEKTSATIFASPLGVESVIEFRKACGISFHPDCSGSSALREYCPFLSLNGDTWKSLAQCSEKTSLFGFPCSVESTSSVGRPLALCDVGCNKYIRRSSKVLFTSRIMALNLFSGEYRYQNDTGLKL
jgi:hypothetical protein